MANFVLPITARTRRGFPNWVDEQITLGQEVVKYEDADVLASNTGLVFMCGNIGDTYIPIASNITGNKVEVLIKLEKLHTGNQSYNNTGGAIVFRPDNPKTYNTGYQFCLSSGSGSGVYLYNYTKADGFGMLGGATMATINTLNKPVFIRARREGVSLKMKVWFSKDIEPSTWTATSSNSEHDVTSIGFLTGSYNQVLKLHAIAYATDGDTASFDSPDVVDMVAGNVVGAKTGDVVNIHDVVTHDVIDSISLTTSGAWVSSLYNNNPVYARVEKSSGSEYDLLFAKYGNTYLSGDYPDSSIKDDGAPSSGEVSILYRSNDPILGGVTIAKTLAAQSGEWRVSGLQHDISFDVVARKNNRKDAIVSNVSGFPDPDFKFYLLGQIRNINGYLTGLVLAKGAAQPLTVSFDGIVPYGISAEQMLVSENIVTSDQPLRDYGNFNFDMRVTDANSKSVISNIDIVDAERTPFVEFIGSVNSMDRGSGTSPITAIIPANVLPGDVLVIGIMRRGDISISDNNQGVWTLNADLYGAPIYEQGTSIYTRIAVSNDAGKTVTVSAPYNGRLIVYMSIYRGVFAKLRVKSAHIGAIRYDSTYQEQVKNLQPITHSSGFLIRAVSNVFAANDASSAQSIISGMISTGPEIGEPKRMQVSYKHLPTEGVLSGTTYDTTSANSGDILPDVAIILDEIRP